MTRASAVRLSHARIRDFRNIARADLDIPRDGLALIGDNGQGKTNFLEALYYLHLLRSVRGARDVDLVRFGADAFHVATVVSRDGADEHDVGAGFERRGRRKRISVRGAPVERMSDGLAAVPAVFCSPADAQLAAGAASERRRYLDIVLALTSPRYLSALQRYRATLTRRNAALRTPGARERVEEQASLWEPALAEHGAVLWLERLRWVEWAAGEFARLSRAIGEQGDARMRYVSSRAAVATVDAAKTALLDALAAHRAADARRGVTQSGPHRDDLELTVRAAGDEAARELRAFGSAGQQRTAAVALRLLEARTLRERLGCAPLLLLDDPFAELDARRSARILELLFTDGDGQAILAVPREEDVPRELGRLQRMHVTGGEISA